MASCFDELWVGSGWCGNGACINASAAGQGAAGCVCDSDWALERRLVNPEVSAPRCTISLLRFRVLNAVLMAIILLLAALTARSMLLGSLGRRRGCVRMLGISIGFAVIAAALARGPEASAPGVAWRGGFHALCIYFFVSVDGALALDKYLKAVKGSASGQSREQVADESLERETVGTCVGLAALWAVFVPTLVAVNWPSDGAFIAAEGVYGMLVCLTHALQAHVVFKALDSDLAFVGEHASRSDIIDKIRRLRRKISLTRNFVVRAGLFLALIFSFVVLLGLSPSGPPVWRWRDEIRCVEYFSFLFGQIKRAALGRMKSVRALSRSVIAPTKAGIARVFIAPSRG
jgi:hypothetical protein